MVHYARCIIECVQMPVSIWETVISAHLQWIYISANIPTDGLTDAKCVHTACSCLRMCIPPRTQKLPLGTIILLNTMQLQILLVCNFAAYCQYVTNENYLCEKMYWTYNDQVSFISFIT